MPGRYCAVFACNTDGSAHTGITLCKFPQQTSIRREWIRFVQDNSTDFLPPTMCSPQRGDNSALVT